MLATERILLLPPTKEDLPLMINWRNNETVKKYLLDPEYLTLENYQAWSQNTEPRLDLMLQLKAEQQLIGVASLSQIDHQHQKAEYQIIIGEPEYWGNGYAYEASTAVFEYAFAELNLNRIYLKLLLGQQRAVALFEKLGFQEEGILRQEVFKNGKFQDLILMARLGKSHQIEHKISFFVLSDLT